MEAPTLQHLLPHLTPNDLFNLELVSPDIELAIRKRRYWKPVFWQYLKQDAVARRIDRRRNGAGRAMFDLTGTLFRNRYLRIEEQKERLEQNLRDASFKTTSLLPPESTRLIGSTVVSEGTLFISWSNQVWDTSWRWLLLL